MRFFCFLFFLFLWGVSYAQQDTVLFYLDAAMKYTSKENAFIIGRRGVSDSNVRVNYFLIGSDKPSVSIDYADASFVKRNGKQIEYHTNGTVSKLAHYKNEVADGLIIQWNSEGQITDSAVMVKGIKTSRTNFEYRGDRLYSRITENIADDCYEDLRYDSSGAVKTAAIFKGDKGIRIRYENGTAVGRDSVFAKTCTDARFPGGSGGWIAFLQKTLDPEVAASRKVPVGIYTTIVQFVVNVDGTLSDIQPLTKNGYRMEEEAVRVIKKSPNWEPAKEYGVPVKGFRKQPITFQYAR